MTLNTVSLLATFFSYVSLVTANTNLAKVTIAAPIKAPAVENYRFEPPTPEPSRIVNGINNDGRLLDVVLCASVDGKFHALDRNTGRKLWSMESDSVPDDNRTLFQPLVRTDDQSRQQTTYPTIDGDDEEDFHIPLEKYVVEPQSGDIYVIPDPSAVDAPLQKLPLTISKLVDSSPFTLPGSDRVFIGRKETSLIALDLYTGRLSGSFGFGQPSCKWDPWSDVDESMMDLEEFGNREMKTTPRQVIYIGRTDYNVAIHDRSQRLLQVLTSSTYGPNNADADAQTNWTRTPDKRYLQAMPDGQVLCFEAGADMPLWAAVFPEPIVAVFDVFLPDKQSQPILFRQPQPKLIDVFPGRYTQLADLPPKTHVGLVNGALYAMSHINYPLVTFSTVQSRKAKEVEESEECKTDDCLVGAYYCDEVTETRLERLLEGPKRLGIEDGNRGHRLAIGGAVRSDAALLGERPSTALPSSKSSYVTLPDFPSSRPGLVSSVLTDTQTPAIAATLCIFLFCAWWLGVHNRALLRWPANRDHKLALTAANFEPLLEGDPTERTKRKEVRKELDERANEAVAPLGSEQSDWVVVPEAPKLPDEPVVNGEAGEGDADSEDEKGDEAGAPGAKKRVKRRNRGRGRRGKKADADAAGGPEEQIGAVENPESPQPHSADIAVADGPSPIIADAPSASILPVESPGLEVHPPLVAPSPNLPLAQLPPSLLMLTDVILGYGSHGTIVYRGSLQGRPVAVKRLLQDFVTLASREVALLQESDDHPNVIRYFYQEQRDSFLYIALELCPASLADIIEKPDNFPEIRSVFEPKQALMQITRGLRHLHSLKIVHRDIKPQNILISKSKKGALRLLISDFGLCKKLEMDQTSFLPTQGSGPHAAGTHGWRAPEILRGEVKLDMQSADSSFGGKQDSQDVRDSNGSSSSARLTKSVDIFALGCLFYYTLSGGEHPFGDHFVRESNIIQNTKTLQWLDRLGEEGAEAEDLIGRMLDPDPQLRSNTDDCLIHPFFWTPARRLSFLQDASDRFEVMERDPKEAPLVSLEVNAPRILGSDWHRRLDKVFIENLGKFRKYDGKSVQDLLRALRNKKHHYQDLPEHVKRHLGPLPEGFLAYFTRRFPQLFLHVYGVISGCSIRQESMFRSYFDHSEV